MPDANIGELLNLLLIFVPIAIVLEFLRPEWHTAIFVAAALGIVSLAGWLGASTEQLARRTGEGVGGLLNATFGNAAELIIALVALQKGPVSGGEGVAHRLHHR